MSLLENPAGIAGLVTRELRTGERDGAPTRIAVARREYATTPDDLWNALTDPERIPRWFLPISGELRVGGRYALEGNASGTVEACDAPRRFALTWEMMGAPSWVTVTLAPTASGTELELVHEAHVPEEFWTVYGPGAVGIGWDGALMGLGLHVETGDTVTGEDAERLPFTDEGRAFYRAAADGWTDAAIAVGEDPDAMRAAGEGAYAFYTTAPAS
ncbi:MAG: SRPBCC family protein [Microbacteriaceae bacterium]|nr:MAG: SRPBCC family protein [Microbacteriaceae bacterium]